MWGYTVLVCIVNVKKNGTFCVNWKALYSIIFGNQYISCRFGIQNSLCCYGKPCLWKAALSMLFRKRYIFLSFGKWYISCHLERY